MNETQMLPTTWTVGNRTMTMPTTWTMGNYPPDMTQVDVWDLTGVTLAYRDGGAWKDAVTGIVLPHSAEITHWKAPSEK